MLTKASFRSVAVAHTLCSLSRLGGPGGLRRTMRTLAERSRTAGHSGTRMIFHCLPQFDGHTAQHLHLSSRDFPCITGD